MTDLRMSPIGFGTWSLRGKQCVDSVRCALDCGYRLIDTASFYENETQVGQAIRDCGINREDIIVQTKLYPNQYDDAPRAIDQALARLDVGYIDILMLHHPAHNDVKAYRAIEEAIAKGKVKAAGISCYYIKECESFLPKISVKPLVIQNEIHPLYQDREVVEYIQRLGIGIQSWYPLGGREHIRRLLQMPNLLKIAHAHNRSLVQVVLRWHLQRGICPLPESSNSEHIRENINVFDFALSDAEMKEIENLNRNEKHDWY